jgi:hypothetical protein
MYATEGIGHAAANAGRPLLSEHRARSKRKLGGDGKESVANMHRLGNLPPPDDVRPMMKSPLPEPRSGAIARLAEREFSIFVDFESVCRCFRTMG